jgi:hypothetical protein
MGLVYVVDSNNRYNRQRAVAASCVKKAKGDLTGAIADYERAYASASTEAFLLRTAIACCSSSKSNGLDIIMSTLSSS